MLSASSRSSRAVGALLRRRTLQLTAAAPALSVAAACAAASLPRVLSLSSPRRAFSSSSSSSSPPPTASSTSVSVSAAADALWAELQPLLDGRTRQCLELMKRRRKVISIAAKMEEKEGAKTEHSAVVSRLQALLAPLLSLHADPHAFFSTLPDSVRTQVQSLSPSQQDALVVLVTQHFDPSGHKLAVAIPRRILELEKQHTAQQSQLKQTTRGKQNNAGAKPASAGKSANSAKQPAAVAEGKATTKATPLKQQKAKPQKSENSPTGFTLPPAGPAATAVAIPTPAAASASPARAHANPSPKASSAARTPRTVQQVKQSQAAAEARWIEECAKELQASDLVSRSRLLLSTLHTLAHSDSNDILAQIRVATLAQAVDGQRMSAFRKVAFAILVQAKKDAAAQITAGQPASAAAQLPPAPVAVFSHDAMLALLTAVVQPLSDGYQLASVASEVEDMFQRYRSRAELPPIRAPGSQVDAQENEVPQLPLNVWMAYFAFCLARGRGPVIAARQAFLKLPTSRISGQLHFIHAGLQHCSTVFDFLTFMVAVTRRLGWGALHRADLLDGLIKAGIREVTHLDMHHAWESHQWRRHKYEQKQQQLATQAEASSEVAAPSAPTETDSSSSGLGQLLEGGVAAAPSTAPLPPRSSGKQRGVLTLPGTLLGLKDLFMLNQWLWTEGNERAGATSSTLSLRPRLRLVIEAAVEWMERMRRLPQNAPILQAPGSADTVAASAPALPYAPLDSHLCMQLAKFYHCMCYSDASSGARLDRLLERMERDSVSFNASQYEHLSRHANEWHLPHFVARWQALEQKSARALAFKQLSVAKDSQVKSKDSRAKQATRPAKQKAAPAAQTAAAAQ